MFIRTYDYPYDCSVPQHRREDYTGEGEGPEVVTQLLPLRLKGQCTAVQYSYTNKETNMLSTNGQRETETGKDREIKEIKDGDKDRKVTPNLVISPIVYPSLAL